MKKKNHKIVEAYRRIRKPVAPPTRVEEDRREKLRREEDEKEMNRRTGRKAPEES